MIAVKVYGERFWKMSIEECYAALLYQYGDKFKWKKADPGNAVLEESVRQNIATGHPLFGMKMQCLALNETTGELLFCTEHGQFVIVFLNESAEQKIPAYKLFDTHQELKEYWIQEMQNSI